MLFHNKPNFVKGSISYLNFLDWQRDNRSFDAMAAYRNAGGMTLTGAGEAENVKGEMVSAGFFELLGVVADRRPHVHRRRRPSGRESRR